MTKYFNTRQRPGNSNKIMKLTRRQIAKIKTAWIKASIAEQKAQELATKLGEIISQYTGVTGSVDHLQGDGHGFTLSVDDDVHIYIGDLIQLAEQGEDITEDLILNNLTL